MQYQYAEGSNQATLVIKKQNAGEGKQPLGNKGADNSDNWKKNTHKLQKQKKGKGLSNKSLFGENGNDGNEQNGDEMDLDDNQKEDNKINQVKNSNIYVIGIKHSDDLKFNINADSIQYLSQIKAECIKKLKEEAAKPKKKRNKKSDKNKNEIKDESSNNNSVSESKEESEENNGDSVEDKEKPELKKKKAERKVEEFQYFANTFDKYKEKIINKKGSKVPKSVSVPKANNPLKVIIEEKNQI